MEMTEEYNTLVSIKGAKEQKIKKIQMLKKGEEIFAISKDLSRDIIIYYEDLLRISQIKFHVESKNDLMIYAKD